MFLALDDVTSKNVINSIRNMNTNTDYIVQYHRIIEHVNVDVQFIQTRSRLCTFIPLRVELRGGAIMQQHLATCSTSICECRGVMWWVKCKTTTMLTPVKLFNTRPVWSLQTYTNTMLYVCSSMLNKPILLLTSQLSRNVFICVFIIYEKGFVFPRCNVTLCKSCYNLLYALCIIYDLARICLYLTTIQTRYIIRWQWPSLLIADGYAHWLSSLLTAKFIADTVDALMRR